MENKHETNGTLQDRGNDEFKRTGSQSQCSLQVESKTAEANSSSWKYLDGWAEDSWQQEFDRHPFFMTKSPEPNADLHPMLEGLQQLKYGEEDNTAEELAETYKKDGLLSFKLGKYRDAILNFNAALKYQCSNELRSQLFNNKAASHFFLCNYRSALQDSQEALKLNPNYAKAKLRIPQCLFHLENYQECIDACENILLEDKTNTKIRELRDSAMEKKQSFDRDRRKTEKKLRDEEKVVKAIKDRRIRFKIKGEGLHSLAQLDLPSNPPGLNRVSLNENCLVWSAIIAFPEARIFECVQSFHENITFAEILEEIFEVIHTEWDTKKQYTKDTVSIYFKDDYGLPIKISVICTLITAQQHPRYIQDSGVPHFYVLKKNSEAEKEFLNDCHRITK